MKLPSFRRSGSKPPVPSTNQENGSTGGTAPTPTAVLDDRPRVERLEVHADPAGSGPPTGSGGFKKRRKYSRRPRRMIAYVLAATAAVLAALAAYLFYFSPVFALEKVVVEGVKGISPQHIVDVADLNSGTPLARIDSGDVESRIRDIAAISQVSVGVRWPHTLVINVVERTPIAYMKTPNGYVMVDENDAQFDTQKRKPAGMPLLDVTDPAAQAAALKVVAALPPDVRKRLQSVTADNPQKVVLHLSNGVTVVWGGVEQSELKAQVLRALLAKTKFKWFDLRAPDAPTGSNASPTPATPPPTPTPGAPSGSANPSGSAPPGPQGAADRPDDPTPAPIIP